MPGERRPGRDQLVENLSLRILDGDAIGREPRAPIVGSERRVGRRFLAEPDGHIGPFELAGLSFQAPEHAADNQIGAERFKSFPVLEPAVSLDYAMKCIAHRQLQKTDSMPDTGETMGIAASN